MTLSFPECNFSTIANFQSPQLLLSPLIITTSPIWRPAYLSLWFRLCRSLRATRYSWWNLLQAASLNFSTYFCRFLKASLIFSYVTSWSVGDTTSRSRKRLFGVNGWCALSSSMYVRGLLLKLTSTSGNTSSSSAYLRCLLCESN